jgi:hypothetical protein
MMTLINCWLLLSSSSYYRLKDDERRGTHRNELVVAINFKKKKQEQQTGITESFASCFLYYALLLHVVSTIAYMHMMLPYF